jgi:hypothetical protein
MGMSQAEGNRRVRLQVAKVGEYQQRGGDPRPCHRAESAKAAARRQPHLPVPALVCLAPGVRMLVAQAPRGLQGGSPPPLLRGRMVATCRWRLAVQPDEDRDHSVPLPGSSDPIAVGERGDVNEGVTTGLVESRMRRDVHVRSEGGPGRRISRKAGTAPWADPTGRPGPRPGTPAPTPG